MIDHLIVVTSDLDATREQLSAATGVAGTYGGANPVNATRNVLYGFEDVGYLELMAVHEDGRAAATRGLPFGLETLAGVRVAGWAVQVRGLDEAVRRAEAAGAPLAPVVAMSRTRPDGVRLDWRMTYPVAAEGGASELEALCPFLIDWGESEHPSTTLRAQAQPLELSSFEILASDPGRVRAWLEALGAGDDATLRAESSCGFRITVRGPGGSFTFPSP